MTASTCIRCSLFSLHLGLCGCVTVEDAPLAARTEPPQPSVLDRVLRRTPPPTDTDPAIDEVSGEPQDPGRLSLAYAKLMEQAGDLTQAETHYSRVLSEDPKSLDALVGLGRVHQLGGRYAAAEEAFNRVVKQNPNSAPALHGLGQTYAARQRWDEATELLNQAVLADPANESLRYDLAVAQVESGNVDAALPHFIRTVGDAEAHYNIGLILHRAGRLPESEQQFRLALAKKPTFAEARYWLDQIQQQHTLPAIPPATAAAEAGSSPSGPIRQIGYQSP